MLTNICNFKIIFYTSNTLFCHAKTNKNTINKAFSLKKIMKFIVFLWNI